jgi:UDP-GlcNAc:undecaprenyl-phosphate GlcNAc-1-phosphate transferase
MNYLQVLVVPFVLSALLIPLIKTVSKPAMAWAQENSRTIHHGIISRIGGVAIYISFSIALALFFEPDKAVLGIYLACSLMFFTGLADDFLDLPAKLKLVMQILSAVILISFGVKVDTLRILSFTIDDPFVCTLFTVIWVVGITNAINLLDGLDGLCGGLILVVLFIVLAISIVDRRSDIIVLSLMLAGSILGFLLYNAHPASIFMGDCGSLFLGCMVASISMLGFKSSTAVTLALPILILILPIADTLSAILRRRLANVGFDHADKSHLHHQLMRRFGQTNSVIIMCAMTFLCGMSAFLYIYSKGPGLVAMIVMVIAIDLFIEKTGMISSSYHPLLSLLSFLFRPLRRKKKKKAQNV